MDELSKVKVFYLTRHKDVTGMSGEGVVAVGVIFSDGQAVYKWLDKDGVSGAINIRKSLDDVIKIHGHEGCTTVTVKDWVPADSLPI